MCTRCGKYPNSYGNDNLLVQIEHLWNGITFARIGGQEQLRNEHGLRWYTVPDVCVCVTYGMNRKHQKAELATDPRVCIR